MAARFSLEHCATWSQRGRSSVWGLCAVCPRDVLPHSFRACGTVGSYAWLRVEGQDRAVLSTRWCLQSPLGQCSGSSGQEV